MTELTPEARQMLERYLAEVRAALGGSPARADEVEADIREHVAAAVAEKASPCSGADMAEILEKLGSPAEWVTGEEESWLARLGRRLRRGPEDWRLAYLAFGLLLLGLFFALVGGSMRDYAVRWSPDGRHSYDEHRDLPAVIQAMAVAFLIGTFLASRAAVAAARDRAGLGAQKWLVLPQLAVVGIILAVNLFAWPVFLGVAAGESIGHGEKRYEQRRAQSESLAPPQRTWGTEAGAEPGGPPRPAHPLLAAAPEKVWRTHAFRWWAGLFDTGPMTVEYWVLWGLFTVDATVAWWLAVALAFRRWPGFPRALFRPFLDSADRRSWTRLAKVEAVALAVLLLCTAAFCWAFRA